MLLKGTQTQKEKKNPFPFQVAYRNPKIRWVVLRTFSKNKNTNKNKNCKIKSEVAEEIAEKKEKTNLGKLS